MKIWLSSWWNKFSFVGLFFAVLFFAASVTPSLLPRHYLVQGILSGMSLAVGYGFGVLVVGLYRFLALPEPQAKTQRISKIVSSALVAIVTVTALWQMTAWQNSIRTLMEMPPHETAYPMRVIGIALIVGIVLLVLGRLFITANIIAARVAEKFAPRRIALFLSFSFVSICVLLLTNDLIAAMLLRSADNFFAELDQITEEGIQPPSDFDSTEGEESYIDWDSIGRQGKLFLTQRPTQQEIEDFHNKVAKRPIRVYVGMRSRSTMEERAELALKELKRVGGFQRSVLIVATPTGTGWLDPSAVDTVEYMHRGDTAIVSMQYSYLPSWITLLVEPQHSIDSATALFDEIYSYWKTLPRDSRPRLYVHGLSLGALGAEGSADVYTIFEDPIQGAVFSGTPFPSVRWQQLVRTRNEGSPIWLPKFRDSRLVRFTSQKNALEPEKAWGPLRVAYIQYASDPMVWFSPELAWRQPDWLIGKRGPDVSPQLRWYPIVTFLQAAYDMPMATSVPLGFGHNYSPSSYIDAWNAVTTPNDWTEEMSQRLKDVFNNRATPKP
ncbi:alpha/beta hydrolase [Thalassoroseus pseudoceratinae]|uniref:alpha/beta hydrolase n=1 Tax=Thalassoroseus pseudoceratinae TaxID=2713176 RepID=UPI001980F5D4|nr:alpha/beta-hydrolase family protein [Thalassoroseus pseudoceratinae]